MPVTIQAGLLLALIAGVWFLAFRVHSWETRLLMLERAIGYRWTVNMERDAWVEFERTGKAPDVDRIRSRYDLP